MTRGRKAWLAALCAAGIAGCAMPSTTVRTSDERPSLAVVGAAPDTTLLVDGKPVGAGDAYTGLPFVLRVEPGTHVVELREPTGAIVFSETVFVETGTKTVRVR